MTAKSSECLRCGKEVEDEFCEKCGGILDRLVEAGEVRVEAGCMK